MLGSRFDIEQASKIIFLKTECPYYTDLFYLMMQVIYVRETVEVPLVSAWKILPRLCVETACIEGARRKCNEAIYR